MDDIETLTSKSLTLAHRAAISIFQFNFVSDISKEDLHFLFATRFVNTLLEQNNKAYALGAIEMYVSELQFVASHIALRSYSEENDDEFQEKSKKILASLLTSETYDGMVLRNIKSLEQLEGVALKSSSSREKIAEGLDDIARSLSSGVFPGDNNSFSGAMQEHIKSQISQKREETMKKKYKNIGGFI